MEKELLNVGDILYSYHKYGKGVNKHTVKRVTNTQAILDNGTSKVRREICVSSSHNKRYCNEIGGYGIYYLEDEEINGKYEWWIANREAYTNMQMINIDKMTKEQLIDLTNFLSQLQPK